MVARNRVHQVNAIPVCVGIITRNRATILPKVIASAQAQSYPGVKIMVIDDGSDDGTADLRSQFPAIGWMRRISCAGFISARGELMAQVGYDYFVSLDDDAWFVKGDEIATSVEFLEENPAVAAVAFDILSPDRPEPVPRKAPKQTAMFIGCGHVLRLSAVREVGTYEPAPGQYGGEEKDLCLRLLEAGYKIMKMPGVHVWHDRTPVAREISKQHCSGVCNDLVMTVRRTPWMLLPAALISKTYRHLAFALRHRLLGPALSGFGLFFATLPATWRTRSAVRAATLRRFMQLREP